MNEFINSIRADKIILRCIILSLVFLGAHLLFLIIFFHLFPPYLPIYNQLPWGIERLGTKLEIFVPFMIILILSIINTLLQGPLNKKNSILARMITTTTVLINLLGLIFILRIILLIV